MLESAPTPGLQQLLDGAYVYAQPPGTWCLNNAGVIAGDELTVIIDTVATQSRAQAMRAAVDSVAAGGRRLVVNTHHHGDHTFGNAAFPEAVVVGHHRLRPEALHAGLGLCTLWPTVQWGDIQLVPPTLTFQDRLTLHTGGHEVTLEHLGPAHTSHDVIASLPGFGVLFAGDLVMSGVTPFFLMGSLSGMQERLAQLHQRAPEVVVPGHGPVGGPELIEQNIAYLDWVADLARRGRRRAQSPLELARATDLGTFGELADPERLVANLWRAYAELDGAPQAAAIDVAAAFAAMVELAGRHPECAA